MAVERIRGSEVFVSIIQDGKVISTFRDIKDFSFEPTFELKSEGYLGEAIDRRDEIWKGCAGKVGMHLSSKDFIAFIKSVKDRAQRRTPGTQVNIGGVLEFPNGDVAQVLIKNCFFGTLPVNSSARDAYVDFTVNYNSEDIDFI